MAYSIGVNNPFLRSPGPGAAETAARGAFYGAKIRTGGILNPSDHGIGRSTPTEPKLYWVYGKKTWANCGGLGFPAGKLNITTTGQLALYSPKSNLPLLPILTGVDTTNEGAMGSVVKATVSFTMYPSLTSSGVSIDTINRNFFTPGANVSCQFGWSTYAAVACASRFGFSGKVVNFSWSVNTDVSVNASTSVVAPGAIATGVSANMQKQNAETPAQPTTNNAGQNTNGNANQDGEQATPNPLDAKQVNVSEVDLATAIDKAMATLDPLKTTGTSGAAGSGNTGTVTQTTNPPGGTGKPEEIYGIEAWDNEGPTPVGQLLYVAIGIPWMPEPPEKDEVSDFDRQQVEAANADDEVDLNDPNNNKPVKSDAQKILDDLKKKQQSGTNGSSGKIEKPIVKKFWYVSFGSMETFLSPLIKGASNGEIKKIDICNDTKDAGAAGFTSAYPMEVIWNNSNYGMGVANPGTNNVRGSSPIGNIWFNTDFVKETWRRFFNDKNTKTSQKKLTQFLNDLCSRANEACGDFWQLSTTVVEKFSSCGGVGGRTSVLAVEDFSYCPPVGAFSFNASFGRPMLKNVSVSCKSSSTMGAAVMGGGNVDVPGKKKVTWGTNPDGAITILRNQVEKTGINTAWGDAFKGLLKLKKKAMAEHHSKTMILFPIDFSVTIDGCSGWQFNEAVNTNLKPPGYGGSRFAISGISNKIDASSWETSITAIMRA